MASLRFLFCRRINKDRRKEKVFNIKRLKDHGWIGVVMISLRVKQFV